MWYLGASLIAQLVKNPPAKQEIQVWFLGQEDPLEKGKTTHSSILAWRSPWPVFYGVAQSQTRLKRLSSSSSKLGKEPAFALSMVLRGSPTGLWTCGCLKTLHSPECTDLLGASTRSPHIDGVWPHCQDVRLSLWLVSGKCSWSAL